MGAALVAKQINIMVQLDSVEKATIILDLPLFLFVFIFLFEEGSLLLAF